jgi:ribosomal protein S12
VNRTCFPCSFVCFKTNTANKPNKTIQKTRTAQGHHSLGQQIKEKHIPLKDTTTAASKPNKTIRKKHLQLKDTTATANKPNKTISKHVQLKDTTASANRSMENTYR